MFLSGDTDTRGRADIHHHGIASISWETMERGYYPDLVPYTPPSLSVLESTQVMRPVVICTCVLEEDLIYLIIRALRAQEQGGGCVRTE